MSIDQEKVIDIVGDDEKTNEVLLFITDHLAWDGYINEHIYKLQEKINAYLAAIESGELEEKHPSAKGKKIVIVVLGKNPLPKNDLINTFCKKAIEVVRGAGFELKFEFKP